MQVVKTTKSNSNVRIRDMTLMSKTINNNNNNNNKPRLSFSSVPFARI
jgi:hypothetical protein